MVEGAYVADFDPDYYRSDRKDQKVQEFTILLNEGMRMISALERAVEEGRIVAESQNFTRDLVNEPSNRMTPTILADRARKMCEEVGLPCEVYGPDKIKELKMGAFWSVAQGSDEEPRLIVMRYEPKDAPPTPVLGLVGKGITFDTGGISIKPADGMEKMKYDMAGGATMIGAMRAIALLKPNVRVIGIVCATENMPSGKAQKPGDVQIAMSGKSIEIINTDAEGRLVLADGLHYARQLGATHLLDAATLTGACVVALGYVNAGVFCNDEKFFEQFDEALKLVRRKDVAPAGRCRVSGADQVRHRRHQEHRRTLGRGDFGRHVPQGIRGRDAMDSPRHRRHCLDRRRQIVDCQRPQRHRRVLDCRAGKTVRRQRKEIDKRASAFSVMATGAKRSGATLCFLGIRNKRWLDFARHDMPNVG